MIEFAKDYLYAFDTDTIDNKRLYHRCVAIEKILNNKFPNADLSWYGNAASANNREYNLFSFLDSELIKLYQYMVKTISPLLEDECYVLKSWMNVYRVGQQVNWHRHWPPEFKVWHGFYCVNVGESATHYKIPGIEDIVVVPSKEGRLVVGKSDDDRHKSTPWNNPDSLRITLAFDIVPINSILSRDIYSNIPLNHYIPFKAQQS
jgi:hypothetical protein